MNKIPYYLKVGDRVVTKGLHEAKVDNILFDVFFGWRVVCVFKYGDTYKLNEYSINWQKTNELNNKQMKEFIIECPSGFEVDKEKSTFEKIVFKEIENKLPDTIMGGIPYDEDENCYTKDDLHGVKDKILRIVESHLNENLWVDHFYENGYPEKVISKAYFLGMLNEIKLSKLWQ